MADDAQTVTQENIQVYQERLYALIDKGIETPSLMTNLAHVSLLLGTRTQIMGCSFSEKVL